MSCASARRGGVRTRSLSRIGNPWATVHSASSADGADTLTSAEVEILPHLQKAADAIRQLEGYALEGSVQKRVPQCEFVTRCHLRAFFPKFGLSDPSCFAWSVTARGVAPSSQE